MTVLATLNGASSSTKAFDRLSNDNNATIPLNISSSSRASSSRKEIQQGEDTVMTTHATTQVDEQRSFEFNINNDCELQTIVDNDNDDVNIVDIAPFAADKAVTSEYVLSKLYNYMKISEMSKYGIKVFKMTFSSYLPYLTESDIYRLSTSYWCNGQHFNCIVSHRGATIKSNARLSVEISQDLLDAAMQSGASVDKIEAMLVQKRIDNKVQHKKCNKKLFYHTKYERNFYLRNLHHRFWNHEVLVRVFIQNGWMTPHLAHAAMNIFVKNVYRRVIESKFALLHNQKKQAKPGNIGFSENFLHSFFVSYFSLDSLPKMYRNEILDKKQSNMKEECCAHMLSEATLRRWCELIELLASRGANINAYEFKKIIPLQYALKLGKNTYKIITSSHVKKNKELLPESYNQHNIVIPNDIWDITVAYL